MMMRALARVVVGIWHLALLIATLVPAAAQNPGLVQISVRYGDHPGFGRIVFDVEDPGAILVEQVGDVAMVHLPAIPNLPLVAPPRNVLSVSWRGDGIALLGKPGVRLRRAILENRLVIDMLDPISARIATFAPTNIQPLNFEKKDGVSGKIFNLVPHVTDEGLVKKSASFQVRPDNFPVGAGPGQEQPNNSQNILLEPKLSADLGADPIRKPEETTVALQPQGEHRPPVVSIDKVANTLITPVSIGARNGQNMSLPFGPQTGVAAFRRGSDAYIVFDERKAIDVRSLANDPVFKDSSITLLPDATIFRMTLSDHSELRVERHAGGINILAVGGDAMPSILKPISLELKDGKVLVPLSQPGAVVPMVDPLTGGLLLVGTQRQAGEGVLASRRATEFTLAPTWQGVVLEAFSDSVDMRTGIAGFVVIPRQDEEALSIAGPNATALRAQDARNMTRVFDLPDLSSDALVRRLQSAVVASGALPAQSRVGARQAVAEAMVALALGAEAAAVVDIGLSTDVRTDHPAIFDGLSGVAALLAGRLSEAGGLANPRLDGSDEISFWRSVRRAMISPGEAGSAQVFANTLPLLLSYPDPLRQRLLPLVTETLIAAGLDGPARVLLEAHAEARSLDLGRAMLARKDLQHQGVAAAQFAALANGSDRLVRFRAARIAAEMKLESGEASAADTAKTLEKLLYAWRGDQREVDLWFRVAELKAEAGQWRPALQLLREAEQLWPDRKAMIRSRLMDTFSNGISSVQPGLKPFDLVAMSEENPDLMPTGEAGQRVAERVLSGLLDLDLPDRAAPFLEKMVASAPTGVARASFGAQLAELRLEQLNSSGALAALTSSTTDTLPAALLERRTLIFASAVARAGDIASAKNALLQLDTDNADLRLADLAESAKSWADVVMGLSRHMSRMPQRGTKLDESDVQALIRLASAANEAGDKAVITQLRERDPATFPRGKNSDLLQLLIARPVAELGDLPRAQADINLARSAQSAMEPAKRP